MRPSHLLIVAALLPLASATHYPEWCTPSTSSPDVDTQPSLVGRWYVDIDFGDFFSVWIYEESNGLDGLQRRDEIVDDTCGHPEHGDTIIF